MPGIIRLNNGTELSGNALEDDGILWVDVFGVAFADCVSDFLNAGNLQTITAEEYGAENVYDGYTHLFYAREMPNEKTSIGLTKGVQENV